LREVINFSTKFESLEQINPLITKYQINMCVPDKVAKGYIFSKSVIEGMSNTIRGAGVYAYYFENEEQIGGHEDDIVKVSRGYRRTGEPIPYGFSDPYQEPFWMEINGENWYTTYVYLWTGRNPEIEEVLKKPVWQSMEVAVNDELDSNGNKVVKEAIFLGFCLLQGINPAFEGSKIEKLSLPISLDEIDLLKQEYEQFSNQNQLDLQVDTDLESIQLSNNENNKDNLDTNDLTTLNINTSNEIEEFSNNNTNNQEKEVNEEVIKEAVEKFGLNSNQIIEILNNAMSEYKYGANSWRKYWVYSFDEIYAFINDSEDEKMYRFKYTIENNIATIDLNSKEEVIHGGYEVVGQKIEQMSEEAETKELSTEEMSKSEVECAEQTEEVTESSNEFIDNPAMQELNDKSAEDNKELAGENLENPEEVNASEDVSMSETEEEDKDTIIMSLKQEMSDLQEKFSKMESDLEVYINENTKLKEFKASIEKQNKEFAVETTLTVVLSILSSEEIDSCRLSSEKFSLDDIDIWKNEVKAKAFNFSKGIPEKKPFIQVAFPTSDKPKSGTGLWD